MSFYDFPIYDVPERYDSSKISSTGPHIYVKEDDYTSEAQALLSKILGAAKYDLSKLDVTKVGPDDHFKALDRGLPTDQLMISFGIAPAQLGLNCDGSAYKVILIGGRSLLFCHALQLINGDSNMKKALWGALKSFYNL